MYVYKMKQGNKRATCSSDQDSPCSVISGTSTDIFSPTAMSNSVCSSDDVRSPGDDDASPIPYKKQVLSPRVHAAFSPVTPATPDLMDIDLDELGEISAMTHSWPSPGPLSPSWGQGKGKELDLHGKGKGKGKGDLDLISKGKGQKGRVSFENDEKEQEQEQNSEEVVQSSQQTNTKPSMRRGKNMAVLAKLQKNQEELDFENKSSSNVQKEHVDSGVSSSSDSKSSKPSAEPAEMVSSSLKQPSPSSSSQSQSQSSQNDIMKIIDEKALYEIQSVHQPPPPPPPAPVASKVLEEAGSSELEELAQTLCKSTTELELSAFVTRALDLSVATPVGKTACPFVRPTGTVHVEPAEYLSKVHV